MLQIGKITDYAFIILHKMDHNPEVAYCTKDLSDGTKIPLPTVAKILKALCKNGILVSIKGSQGGYRLLKPLQEISLYEVISCFEPKMGLTECCKGTSKCIVSICCPTKTEWKNINFEILSIFKKRSVSTLFQQK